MLLCKQIIFLKYALFFFMNLSSPLREFIFTLVPIYATTETNFGWNLWKEKQDGFQK